MINTQATSSSHRAILHKYRFGKIKNVLIWLLVATSVIFTILDWSRIQDVHNYIEGISLAVVGIALTEAMFVVGAILMALSVGKSFPSIKKIHTWPGHLVGLIKDARSFAERLLTSRLFAVGFWLNFIGAVGTSAILIFALLKFAPYTGLGVLTVIILDLVSTFGWRIPLEIARRREVKRHGIH